MANQLATNPWTLDTVSTTPAFTGGVVVEHFEFCDYVLDTDTCQVKNRFGNVVWEANGESDLSPVISTKIGWIDGLVLSALTAGKVRVYFK